MTHITPTVGRVLHFFPTVDYMASRKQAFNNTAQPLAAVIAYVHSDTMVNLTVWDQNGEQFSVCSVPLVQEGSDVIVGSFYAQWMPYQKGQAAKTERLESMLNGPAVGSCEGVQSGDAIEQEIQAKGLTAPRITPADIESNIAAEHFFTVGQALTALQHPTDEAFSLLTFCVIKLRNGFIVTGESACASPENFDAEIGRKIARENAIEKIWPLMGYELRTRLHERSTACTCGPNAGCTNCPDQRSGK